jgi:RNA polymerase sigma-70 factor (family 1)
MDEAAFEVLFRDNYERLCSFAATIVGTRDDAEDVVQQVFANLWRGRQDSGIRKSVRAYLFRAVRNGALNRVRGDASIVTLRGSPDRAPGADPPPDSPQMLISRESAVRLHEALGTLGARCREVVRLRWIDGLSHAEIADTLGITRKAVESNITRGLRALRAVLGDIADQD